MWRLLCGAVIFNDGILIYFNGEYFDLFPEELRAPLAGWVISIPKHACIEMELEWRAAERKDKDVPPLAAGCGAAPGRPCLSLPVRASEVSREWASRWQEAALHRQGSQLPGLWSLL